MLKYNQRTKCSMQKTISKLNLPAQTDGRRPRVLQLARSQRSGNGPQRPPTLGGKGPGDGPAPSRGGGLWLSFVCFEQPRMLGIGLLTKHFSRDGRNPMVLFAGGLPVTGCAVDKGPLPALVSCSRTPLCCYRRAATFDILSEAAPHQLALCVHRDANFLQCWAVYIDDTLISARWAKQVLQR